MIKFYCVMPPKAWKFCNENQMKMLVEAEQLLKKVKDVKLYDFGHDWILDNSTALGYNVTLKQYIDLISVYKPPVAVIPDVLNSRDKTLARVKEFVEKLEKDIPDCPSKIMYVPQGGTVEEFFDCLEHMVTLYDPDIVGVPYRYQTPFFLKERTCPIEWALDRSILVRTIREQYPQQELHLLGCWHPYELLTGQLQHVRSIDTSLLLRSVVTGNSPFNGKRDLDLKVFDADIDYAKFKEVYRGFYDYVRRIGGSYAVSPTELVESYRDKGEAPERSSLGSTGGKIEN